MEAALSGGYDPVQPGPSQEIAADVKGLRDFLVIRQGMDEADLEKLDDGDLEALSAYMQEAYGLDLCRGGGDAQVWLLSTIPISGDGPHFPGPLRLHCAQ